MIRVCIVAPAYMTGGQAIQARTVAAGFAGDPDVSIRSQPIDPRLPAWLARIRGVRTIARMPAYLIGLIGAIRDADVVHVFTASFWPFLLTTTPAVLLARLMGRPVILNYHDGRAPAHIGRPWVQWVLRRATVLVFPSEFLLDVFRRFGFDGEVVHNVVETEKFHFRPRDPIAPVLLSSRLLEELYAVDNTIRAYVELKQRYPDARLIIMGAGDREAALRNLVAEEKIDGVDFIGAVPHDDVAAWFDRADILVNSSREDNMPLSLIEAFAAGLAVVTTRAGGIPHIVQHERNGLLVPVDQPAALAAAVLRILEDRALARRLTEQARADCLERYSWPAARLRWSSLYHRLTASGAPSRSTRREVAAL